MGGEVGRFSSAVVPMTLHRFSVLLLLTILTACSGSEQSRSPTTPTPPPADPAPSPSPPPPPSPPSPTPTRWALSGAVTDATAHTPIGGAKLEIIEGVNQGASTSANGEGKYRFDALEPGSFSIHIKADGFENEKRSVTLTADQIVDVALKKAAAPPPRHALTGTVVDAIDDHALRGVTLRVDGLTETTTGADGSFAIDGPDAEQVRTTVITSPDTVERSTRLRVPGPSTTLSLIPSSWDMRAFNEMVRSSGELRRWTTAPSIVIQMRTLKFTSTGDSEFVALAGTMSDTEATALTGDLTWALPQLTGNTFTRFTSERRETAAANDRVSVQRPGFIVIARYEGLTAATGFWGYTRWAWNGAGELQGAVLMLDGDFDSSTSPYLRSLRAHELGHALGYQHVTGRDSLMNANARLEPNAFDRGSAKLAFSRPPLNRAPDIDPDPFTNNLRALTPLFWSVGMP
jgi:Carboxypeptidase regulatory-like domain